MQISEDKPFKLSTKQSIYIGVTFLIVILSIGIVKIANFALKQQAYHSSSAYAATTGTQYYVSKNGNNSDGRSWATAWNELNQINWSLIQPGDTIQIDGGPQSMTYTTSLIPAANGTSASPILITLSTEQGHNGKAIIFGGRTTPLPECDTPLANYVYQTAGVNLEGIDMSINSPSWVTVDGTKWSGIVIYGHNLTGIKLSSGNQNDTFKNLELYDNGQAVKFPLGGPNYDRWRSDEPGVLAHGTNMTFDHMLIHDNGQDVFQSGGGVNNFTITNSWLYNGRPHSSNPSLAYNYCMHSDGFQVYNGGTQSGIHFDHDILGPGLMQGTILGQTYPSPTPPAVVNNVTMSDVLVLDTTNANIMGYGTVTETGWNVDHVTSFHVAYDPDGNQHHSITGQYSNAIVSNSIFSGGQVYLPGTGSYSGNIIYNLTGQPAGFGTNQNPQFTNAPAYTGSQPTLSDYINGTYDFTSPSGAGSRLTSVAQLLGGTPTTPTPIPSNNPTVTTAPTSVPTATPIPPTPTRTPTPLPLTPTSTPFPPTPTFTPIPPTPTRTPTPVPPTPTRTPTPIPPTPTSGENEHTLISIYASGTAGNEIYPTMELRVNNVAIASWTGVGSQGLRTYSFSIPGNVQRNQIKVAFTNDANYGRNNDRNLYVDKIVLAGVVYQSEARTTYAIGGYSHRTCSSGYLRTDWLNCNGYFQY